MLKKLLDAVSLPEDNEEEKLKKITLAIMVPSFALFGLCWGGIYFFSGFYIPAWIPFSYGILSLLSLAYFIVFKHFIFFRFSQILLILLLPFFLQLSLGGAIPASLVILWALLSPLGALVFYHFKQSIIWFIAYILLVLIAFGINEFLPQYFNWQISEDFILLFFLMNIIGVSSMVYLLVYYFVSKQSELKAAIEQQNKLIVEKNNKITDSITYAKRIQQAKLPQKQEIFSQIPQCFILYKPKDIVSGDFYFFQKSGNLIFLAAADCTGHGVPGALMSMLNYEKLETAIEISTNTSDILSLVNKGIKNSLRQSDSIDSSRDGMDIALCNLDMENRVVKYVGANRPIWIIRHQQTILEEIKATKKGIGGATPDEQEFITHSLTFEVGDTFYIFTDGYADQFGGQNDKKLTTKKFKEILINIQFMSMQEQQKYLDDFIEEWKGDKEQIDDILIIGVRF